MCAKSLSHFDSLLPMDCSLPGSSVHGILQVRILERVAMSSPGELPNPGIKPLTLMPPVLACVFFTTEPPGELSTSITKLVRSIQYRFDISQSIYA